MKRRNFIKNVATVSAFSILKPSIVFGTKANSAIRIGIIGCGNRGTAVLSSMITNTNSSVVAMADIFDDQLQKAIPVFNGLNAAKNVAAIPAANIYQGSKAYLKLLENKDVDAVQISTPAYSHVGFLEAAVMAGKHVYCEKPVAPDVAGCRRAIQLGEKLNGKQSVVIGFQIRHASAYAEMVNRIQRGDIGELITVQLYYLSSSVPIITRNNVSDDEIRIRNHFYFNAMSGGILLDQGIHILDICNWALQGLPLNAIGRGNTRARTEIGDTYSNYQVVYQYPNNVNVSIHTTQLGHQFGDVCCRFVGTNGIAEAHYSGGVFINGDNKWDSGIARSESAITPQQQAAGVFLSSLHDADANKEKAFISSIETGNYLNGIRSGAESTLTAILGREAAIKQQTKTWDEVYRSNQKIDPKLNLAQFDK
ncbi:Gfo/Idh/MocA family oxidoreductase [Ferruginibacter paludis]|uniref:Gfo/Idh/MocA family protein n=1 Tax=Ferruginibacter paludis TaxID=1310417 RepID=UPI0025B5CDCD|nr:Gfo/Idh/MocA family oxidoreductase [Ferruginibacter paludis]MDN3657443.1 Gfo/Idh/MocA family oxidoreductase [Ferruginibacter paludis]